MKFLVVDDSKAMRSIITRAMKSVGYTTDVYNYASDGFEALEHIKGDPPDIVFCDLHMPNMSGIELVQVVTNEKLPVKVGIVTADNKEDRIRQAMAAGAAFYLIKPLTGEQLAQTILEHGNQERLVERKRTDLIVLPSLSVFEAAFSSLGDVDVLVESRPLGQFSFAGFPTIVSSLVNQHGRIKFYAVFDCLAVNTISALLNKITVQEALSLTGNNEICDHGIDDVEIFMGLLSVLVRSASASDSYKLHASHCWSKPGGQRVKNLMFQHEDAITMISISAPGLVGGKVIFDPM